MEEQIVGSPTRLAQAKVDYAMAKVWGNKEAQWDAHNLAAAARVDSPHNDAIEFFKEQIHKNSLHIDAALNRPKVSPAEIDALQKKQNIYQYTMDLLINVKI